MLRSFIIILAFLGLSFSSTAFVEAKSSMTSYEDNSTFHYKHNYKKLYKFLNIPKKEYSKSIQNGKSLGEIAVEQGVYEKELIVFLKKEVLKQLHQQWKAGKINTPTYKGIKGHVDDFVKDDIHFKYKEFKRNTSG
ncbi:MULTISPECIES: hypothetical protein [Bacillus cereus group]|uniref:hypothetical protein n=1 Tax=Bacillus cereus group TaxID=86661 RepID=UPI001F45E771|nr:MULTISPECIES: hypothetical protein [Bacillus cereus group]MCE7037840.1 hypothetical protein [Bacillus cereus]